MFILLLLLWILLNGKITGEILIIGILLVWVISNFMYQHLGYQPSGRQQFFRKVGWGLWYMVVLFIEVIKSGVAVLKFVTAKEVDIQPQIVIFPVPLKNETLKIVLANSITLTPGTITLSIEDDLFYVHAFDYTFGEDVVDSVFLRLLLKMEADFEKTPREVDYFE